MKTSSVLAATLVGIALTACSEPPAPPAPPAPPSPPVASSDSPKSFIGRQIDEALQEARKELAKENIDISDGINININGRSIRGGGKDRNLPKAEITPQGDLLIEGKTVAINDSQRAELSHYREQVLGIANAGITIGGKGADLAGEALSGVAGAIFGGDQGRDDFEKRMETRGQELEAEAIKLCGFLPAMLASQQSLAASLPEFKPYAQLTQQDVDDCGKDKDDNSVAVTSDPV